MSAEVFVDTNVLVYAHDEAANEKRRIAAGLLQALWDTRAGRLSTQVLHEFYVTVTRKLKKPVARRDARAIVQTYSAWVVAATPDDMSKAFEIEDEARLSFWDALIVASASNSGAKRLVTEDLSHGQIISGVEIVNPFA